MEGTYIAVPYRLYDLEVCEASHVDLLREQKFIRAAFLL